ncbi:CAF17-like 4Fe-4S cluster assembly/insertion protein YgfZ [Sphingorhabdus sp. M41]|uniref:CAF17-like 4Fe-4S cluster assembly/insertion protein YgfZ n=1 Tax=Sphingorhabdus sp. M41 TaxID=1806885 RepID=UPI00078D5037|nr:folate-binding protein YgfZ [Sphingorhabdus sp. M41]AMO73004.1 aminomethyltransferase [Sphingorhabdus sp. M41]
MTETRLNDRALIRLSPTDGSEDIRAFLQGLVTQDMTAVAEGAPQWSALLTAQGKVLFDFFLWADGNDILIDCEQDQAEALAKRLKLYRLRRKIDIAPDDSRNVHWALAAEGRPVDPRLPALGHRWLDAAETDACVDEAYRKHRLSLGVTEGAAELGSDKTLWLECNAAELNGVSFTKGCYVGQENTARMNYRQKVNRRLVVVPVAQADEKRQRIAYPDYGLSVEHRRVDDLKALDLPDWLAQAL